jgi:hypothetical protein
VIPLTPGGLGLIEGVLISTLVGFHVPAEVASLAVLTYRLVNFWIPIPVGGAAYLSLRMGPWQLPIKQAKAQRPGPGSAEAALDERGGGQVEPPA